MHDAQASQGLDKIEFPTVERAELAITRQKRFELRELFVAIAGEEHPEILHGGSGTRIVQVDDMKRLARDQHVARVEIGVQAKFAKRAGSFSAMFNAVDDSVGYAAVDIAHFVRNEIFAQQVVARIYRV